MSKESHQKDIFSNLFPAKSGVANYLIHWAENQNTVYVETPKVGCTLIKRALQYSEVGFDESRLPPDVHDKHCSPLRSPHDDLSKFMKCFLSDDCFKFSFVRNPISRTLSAYLDKIVGQPGVVTRRQKRMGIDPAYYIPSFDEFIELIYKESLEDMDIHWAPQTFLLGYSSVKYDYLGRFEFFSDSFRELMERTTIQLPVDAMSLGTLHATGANEKFAKFYNTKNLNRIHEIYHDDFLYLGYGWSI